jgi:hypothetical protein
MHSRGWLILTLALSGPALLAGCGPTTATVRGEVTVDGQPLEKGVISYVPADSNGVPVTAEVRNGKYELTTAPGKKVVQISAPVVVGKRKEHNGPGAALVEITEESLPPRYNSSTELTFEVRPGSNTKDWSVTKKAGKP